MNDRKKVEAERKLESILRTDLPIFFGWTAAATLITFGVPAWWLLVAGIVAIFILYSMAVKLKWPKPQ
jgi:Kef-type K+ transport system membrane component KefB